MFTDTGKPINTHTAARKSKRQKNRTRCTCNHCLAVEHLAKIKLYRLPVIFFVWFFFWKPKNVAHPHTDTRTQRWKRKRQTFYSTSLPNKRTAGRTVITIPVVIYEHWHEQGEAFRLNPPGRTQGLKK